MQLYKFRYIGGILLSSCIRTLLGLNSALKPKLTSSIQLSSGRELITTMNSSSASCQVSSSQHHLISYIDSSLAKKIDELLMAQPGFSIDQLMELAGYSVACSVHSYYHTYIKKHTQADVDNYTTAPRVLLYCGPGNNGGDGLVAARHLKHFGFSPFVVLPRQAKGVLFENLARQITDLEIPLLANPFDLDALSAYNTFDVVVDALFGFSFEGPSREPFTSIIKQFASSPVPVLSVDIPSGWDVNEGDKYGTGFTPAGVISLTAPKLCMKPYRGVHYIGGR